MAALKGVGQYVVKGVHGNISYTGAVSIDSTKSKTMGVDRRDEFSVHEQRDGLSSVFAIVADEPIYRLTVRFVPLSPTTSGSLALAKTNCELPSRLSVVTLAGFGNNNLDGTWYYQGGSISMSPDSIVEATMELSRYGTDPAANSLSGAPVDFSA